MCASGIAVKRLNTKAFHGQLLKAYGGRALRVCVHVCVCARNAIWTHCCTLLRIYRRGRLAPLICASACAGLNPVTPSPTPLTTGDDANERKNVQLKRLISTLAELHCRKLRPVNEPQ